jgi:probable HAF family extracellular repeat protein
MTVPRKVSPLLAILVLLSSAAQSATWTTFDVPGASRTYGMGINAAGDVVGAYADSSGVHGFLFRANRFTTIDPPGAKSAYAVGINDSGQIAGWFVTKDQHNHAFLFDASGFTILDLPGASDTVAQGINNAGEIVGFYKSGGTKAFKWSNGNFATIDAPGALSTTLSGIDNLRHVVGVYRDFAQNDHSFIQNGEGEFRTFPFKAAVFGINDHRTVVGSGTKNGLSYGFRYILRTNRFVKLRFPGAVETECFGINNSGQIVGDYRSPNGKVHGLIRTP